jgi:murein DD-endopeptidase MepM/ murein hydrolase activator NlpD
MNLRSFLLFGFVAFSCLAGAQVYPQHYFQSPMDTPLYLSAPFGSLRDNHFHSGMDIRTQERVGLPVYAVADGYIVRIKYSPYGYGKALYINHSNGYTSVYGHLQNANGPVAAYIKKYQYQVGSFEFDHFPGKDRIPVKKGDTIGWSGNSGGSSGPHLHFEIRNTRTEEILNPQLFGIPVADEQAPAIQRLYVYTFDEQGSNQFRSYPFNFKNSVISDSGTVLLDTILLPQQTVGFALDAVDYLIGRSKEYSLYGMDLQIDNKTYYQFRMDRFTFNDSRCINRHIDYSQYKKEGNRIQKLFVDDGNTVKLYSFLRNKGKYQPADTLVHLIVCKVFDYQMRPAIVYAYVKATNLVVNKNVLQNVVAVCVPNKSTAFQNAFIRVEVPVKAVYDTLNIEYELLPKDNTMLSATHRVHNIYCPLQKNISISIRPDEVAQKEKLLMAYSANGKSWRSAGGDFENGFVTTRSTTFGFYAVTIDTITPVIKALFKNKPGVSDTVALRFKITDNFSGIDSYTLRINGKWVLAEYDAKNDLVEYFFDENTPERKLDMELTVSDKKANKSVFKIEYNRLNTE